MTATTPCSCDACVTSREACGSCWTLGAEPRGTREATQASQLRDHGTVRRSPVTCRRGTVLVLAIWVTLILSGLALVYARSMRVEMIAAGNRLSAEQAAAVERGAEQYVLARVDAALGDAFEVTRAPAEAVAVGGGYFWIVRPRQGDPNNYEYGIVDEASKLNLNVADPIEMAKLPGMDQYIATAVLDWRDDDLQVTNGGAESEYYQGLQVPYRSKDAPLETFEELRLVKGVTDGLLYGEDRNANGAADDLFANARGPARMAGMNGTADRRGLAPFATVLTAERNTDVDGQPRVNVAGGGDRSGPQAPGAPQPQPGGATPQMARQVAQPAPGQPRPGQGQPGQPGQPDAAETALRQVLTEYLKADRVEQILTTARGGRPFDNVFDFAAKGGMTPDELNDVFDRLTHTDDKVLRGRINVNTAPREVLMCLPGLGPDDATALINNRPYDSRGECGWVLNSLTPEALNQCGKMITGTSRQYSADIVSVSGDGRAFKRVRIVVDGRQSPPVIVQRKDLTSLGWPLPEDLRTRMRAGTRPAALFQEVRAQGKAGRR